MLAAAMIGVAPLLAAGTAHAATIVQTFRFAALSLYPAEPSDGGSSLPYGFPGGTAETAESPFTMFNPSLGTLQSVYISIPLSAYSESEVPVIALYQVQLVNEDTSLAPVIFLQGWLGQVTSSTAFNLGDVFTAPGDLASFIGVQSYIAEMFVFYEGGVLGAGPPIAAAFDSPSIATVTYTYSPTPEPATWAMMLLGMFGAGALLRRRENRFRRPNANFIPADLSNADTRSRRCFPRPQRARSAQ
jgi:hypothetical protein